MKRIRVWIGILISLVCLWLALRGVAWHKLGQALTDAQYLWLLPALGALAVTMAARVVRWRLLLGPAVSLRESAAAFGVGYLVSNLFPFRLGDLARAILIGGAGEGRPSRSQALSTVVVERVLDMLMVVLLLVAILPFVPSLPGLVAQAGLIGGLGAVVALALLVWLAGQGERGERWLARLLEPLPRLDGQAWGRRLLTLLEGFDVLRQRRIGPVLIWSVLVWVTNLGVSFCVLAAFDLEPTPVKAAMVLCVTSLGLALPASPGSFGVYHALARTALVLPFDAPVEAAVSFALALHTLQYVALCLWGLVGLMERNLSLAQLRAELGAQADPVEEAVPS